MSEEAVQIVKKLKQLDKRIAQFRANDERILRDGGVRSQNYVPMAPRAEREKEKLVERVRYLEEREGKTYYTDPDLYPYGAPPDDYDSTDKVSLLSREEALEEFASPPTSTDYQTGFAKPGRQRASTRSGNAGVSSTQSQVPKVVTSTGVARRLPEPSWEGLGPVLAGFAGVMALGVVLGYFWLMESFDGVPLPW